MRAAYPGVWLREDVYATHGHYLDRHTTAPGFERLGAGAMSKLLKLPVDQMRSVDDYERILAPIYAWMLAISERGGPELDAADGGTSSKVLPAHDPPGRRAWPAIAAARGEHGRRDPGPRRPRGAGR